MNILWFKARLIRGHTFHILNFCTLIFYYILCLHLSTYPHSHQYILILLAVCLSSQSEWVIISFKGDHSLYLQVHSQATVEPWKSGMFVLKATVEIWRFLGKKCVFPLIIILICTLLSGMLNDALTTCCHYNIWFCKYIPKEVVNGRHFYTVCTVVALPGWTILFLKTLFY